MLTKVEFIFLACEQVSLAVQGEKHYFESFCRHPHRDEKDNGFPFGNATHLTSHWLESNHLSHLQQDALHLVPRELAQHQIQ